MLVLRTYNTYFYCVTVIMRRIALSLKKTPRSLLKLIIKTYRHKIALIIYLVFLKVSLQAKK